MKFKFIIILLCSFIICENSHHNSNFESNSHIQKDKQHENHKEVVDGDVIVHHIQGQDQFEFFNPFDISHPYHFNLNLGWGSLSKYFGWQLQNLTNYKSYDTLKAENPNYLALIFTKQSIMMLLASLIIILLFLVGYKKNKKVQSGLGNLLEFFVVFIRDEVVYPNMGKKQGRKFLPLILTFFFFIVVVNLLGLIPSSATATASLSVTGGLALITFFTYIIFGNKDFWKHIFATPGVPFWILPIMIIVEIIGLFTKPFALAVRLLANMNAGHIIILAFLGIIINMGQKSPIIGYAVSLGSVPMAVAVNMLEIFVAFLQAYVFSLLSSIFIGMAVAEHEHH